jgi:hypothetical protein
LQPLEGKEGPFDASNFAQYSRQPILTRIVTEFSQDQRCRYGSLTDRGSQTEHFLPLSRRDPFTILSSLNFFFVSA